MNYIIRNIDKKDLKSCEDLSKMPELIWASWSYFTKDFLEKYLIDDWTFLVVELDWKVIWYLLWEKLRAWWTIIWSIWIEKDYRWRWIWTKLLNIFEDNIKKDWYEWVYLVWRTESEELKSFYSKNWFSIWKNNTEYEKFF